MVKFRAVLAGLIALAVAVAPVTAALVMSTRVQAATVAAAPAHDCHGNAQHHGKAPHHQSDKAGGPHCQDQDQDHANCVGDGSKCCKLSGMVTALQDVSAPVAIVDLAANLPALTGWQMRPSPPPPRA